MLKGSGPGEGGSAVVGGEQELRYNGGGAPADDMMQPAHHQPLLHKNYIVFDPPHLDFKEQ